MYSKQKEQAFGRRALITMQELKFWNLSHVDQDAFDQECKKLSLDLLNQCEKVDGELEGNWIKNEARQEFEKMIRQGKTRLIDLAIQVEVIYNFNYD
jgi:predicted ArsR family transcriptional regulator